MRVNSEDIVKQSISFSLTQSWQKGKIGRAILIIFVKEKIVKPEFPKNVFYNWNFGIVMVLTLETNKINFWDHDSWNI